MYIKIMSFASENVYSMYLYLLDGVKLSLITYMDVFVVFKKNKYLSFLSVFLRILVTILYEIIYYYFFVK